MNCTGGAPMWCWIALVLMTAAACGLAVYVIRAERAYSDVLHVIRQRVADINATVDEAMRMERTAK